MHLGSHRYTKHTCLSSLAITKTSSTGQFINNGNLFVTGLESGKSKTKHQQTHCLVRALSLQHGVLLLHPHKSEGTRQFPSTSFIKGIHPLPKGPFSQYYHIWDNFGGHQHSDNSNTPHSYTQAHYKSKYSSAKFLTLKNSFLFTSWMYTALTHIHTHPPLSQHTARTQTLMPQTHSHTHTL